MVDLIKSPGSPKEDGSPRSNFNGMHVDPDVYAFLYTGPIAGTFVVDGESYDVTEDVIPVKHEHLAALNLAIHKAHHAAGRFLDAPLPKGK